MKHAAAFEVDKLKLYRPWAKAPKGSLLRLQGKFPPSGSLESITGLRCDWANNPFLLVIDGPHVGELLNWPGPYSAIDVSDCFVICLTEAGPSPRPTHPAKAGCAYTEGPGKPILMWAEIRDPPEACLIQISGPTRGDRVTARFDDLIELGTIVLNRKQERESDGPKQGPAS